MLTSPLQLKHPIVLIHGLGAKGSYGPIDYFYGLPKLLRNANNQIYIADLTAWHTIDHRAKQLKLQIERAFPDQKVNLVGHSMGGLDARYLTAQLNFNEHVASVTTIGTPNRGTSVSDKALHLLPNHTFIAADRILKFMESSSGAFRQITTQYCQNELAQLAPQVPSVAYFSATTAICNPVLKNALPIFWLSHRLLKKLEGDNDGFVSVESAQWGEHICTHAGDHYAQIGQFLGRSRGMDYIKFYQEIFERLKREGM